MCKIPIIITILGSEGVGKSTYISALYKILMKEQQYNSFERPYWILEEKNLQNDSSSKNDEPTKIQLVFKNKYSKHEYYVILQEIIADSEKESIILETLKISTALLLMFEFSLSDWQIANELEKKQIDQWNTFFTKKVFYNDVQLKHLISSRLYICLTKIDLYQPDILKKFESRNLLSQKLDNKSECFVSFNDYSAWEQVEKIFHRKLNYYLTSSVNPYNLLTPIFDILDNQEMKLDCNYCEKILNIIKKSLNPIKDIRKNLEKLEQELKDKKEELSTINSNVQKTYELEKLEQELKDKKEELSTINSNVQKTKKILQKNIFIFLCITFFFGIKLGAELTNVISFIISFIVLYYLLASYYYLSITLQRYLKMRIL